VGEALEPAAGRVVDRLREVGPGPDPQHVDLALRVGQALGEAGGVELHDDAVDALVRRLLPRAFLATPNLAEAARLVGFAVDSPESMERAARTIASMGPRHVLVKGGHLARDAMDLLWSDGVACAFAAPRIDSAQTHGTGCTLSAAIAALLACGVELPVAVARAKSYVHQAIVAGADLAIGAGHGPVDHLYAIKRSPPPA